MKKEDVLKAGRGALFEIQWDDDEPLEEGVIIDMNSTGSKVWAVVDDIEQGRKKRDIGIVSARDIVRIIRSHNDPGSNDKVIQLTSDFVSSISPLL